MASRARNRLPAEPDSQVSKIQIDFLGPDVLEPGRELGRPEALRLYRVVGEALHGRRDEIIIAVGRDGLAMACHIEQEHVGSPHLASQLVEGGLDIIRRHLIVEQAS